MPRLSVQEKTPDVLTPGIRSDAIIMRNNMGENIFVPRSRYEDFEKFLRDEVDPAHSTRLGESLVQMDVAILIDKNLARLTVDARGKLLEPNKRWLTVPLGLGLVQAIPSPSNNETSSTFPPIRVAYESPGYVWMVAPGGELERQLTFEALGKVTSTAQGQFIRLDLPPVSSTLRLELPIGHWDLNVNGTGSEVVEPFQDSGELSIAIVRTAGGAMTLSWSKKLVADQIQSIEVASQTKYTPLTEAGQFRAIANLTIRGPNSLGGSRFQITLPKNSKWNEPVASQVLAQGYRINRLNTANESSETILGLEFEDTVSRTEMEVAVAWQAALPQDGNSIAFAVPKVGGVQRHAGDLDLVVPRSVKFFWDPQPGFLFIKPNDGGDVITYSFRFNQQETDLVAKWTPGERASKLKATYHVTLDQPNLQLVGTIDFVDDISLFPFLQLDVQGWTVDRVQIQPSGRYLDLVANRSSSTVDSNGNIKRFSSIALSLGELLEAAQTVSNGSGRSTASTDTSSQASVQGTSNPSVGSREEGRSPPTRGIAFVLSQRANSSSENSERIQFALPMLSWIDPESQRLSVCASGELTIQSSTSTLSRSESESSSIVSLNVSDIPTFQPPSSQGNGQSSNWRSVLKYKVNSTDSWVEWIGMGITAITSIQARAESMISIGEGGLDLTQTWKLNSDGRMPKSLRIGIPKDWRIDSKLHTDSLRVSMDNFPVDFQLMQESATNRIGVLALETQSRFDWIRLTLPTSVFASSQQTPDRVMTIRKRWNDDRRDGAGKMAFDWLLPILAADKVEDSVVVEHFSGEIKCNPRVRCVLKSPPQDFENRVSKSGVSDSTILFDCTQQDPRLMGELTFAPSEDESEINIESIWLQSTLNAVEQKRDRYVVRFSTKAESISLILPADRIANSKLILNGRKAVLIPNPSNVSRFDVSLERERSHSAGNIENTYVLEVFTSPVAKTQWITVLRAELPQILNSKKQAPVIWQVIAPSTSHVVGNSWSLAPGYTWQWNDLWFSRKSELTQSEIEKQMNATSQPTISQQTNKYVFLSLDPNASMKLWLVPRYLLWLPVALFVLVGSFAIMEFRWIRKPWLAIALLLSGLTFSQWAWDISIALVQSLVAAIGIAIFYMTMKWIMDRRSRRRSVFASRPGPSLRSIATRSAPLSGSSPALANEVPSKNIAARGAIVVDASTTAIVGDAGEVL